MTTFQDRERAFEAKYAHDEHFRFRVAARRDKLFARWAAEQLHLSERGWTELTTNVLAVADGAGHDDRLLEFTQKTFEERGAAVDKVALVEALHRCADQARKELLEP